MEGGSVDGVELGEGCSLRLVLFIELDQVELRGEGSRTIDYESRQTGTLVQVDLLDSIRRVI